MYPGIRVRRAYDEPVLEDGARPPEGARKAAA
jgi:hypothetical protein